MTLATAESARKAGADVTVKRVAELVPEAVAKAAGSKLDQDAPVAGPLELEQAERNWRSCPQATLRHHGRVIVPLFFACQGQSGNDVVPGGSPYGLTTTSDSDGLRQPSGQEPEGAKFQRRRVGGIAVRLNV